MEVNPAGQFLYVEGLAPDLPMLDTFCQFLEYQGDWRAFQPQASSSPVRYDDYYDRIEAVEQ